MTYDYHQNGNLHPESDVGSCLLYTSHQLVGNRLGFACLNVQLSFKEMDGPKRAHSGLIPFHRGQIISPGGL